MIDALDDDAPRHGEGPLAGLLAIDLSRMLAGPHAMMMLGDLGARVIKIEPPGGDDTRRWGPPFVPANGPDVDSDLPPDSTYFLSCNRNKESMVLDLRTDEGRGLLLRLVERADVLCENYRPGVLQRLGLAHEELMQINPRLVILSITGFGHDGPEGDRSGYDQIAQGEAGLMSVTGPSSDEPMKVGVPIADLLAGMYGAFGVLAAVNERNLTGRGRVVRTSLLAAVVGVHSFQGTAALVGRQQPQASGNHHTAIAPYGLFHAADGEELQIAIGSQGLWATFAPLVGLDANDPRFHDNPSRVSRRDELRSLIELALANDSAGLWLDRFLAAGLPAGRVRDINSVFKWEQTKSQGLVIHVDHPVGGRISLPGPPLRFDDQSFAGGRHQHLAPPLLDQHATEVRRWLEAEDLTTVT